MKKILCLLFILSPLILLSQSDRNPTEPIDNNASTPELDSLKRTIMKGGLNSADIPNIIKIQRRYLTLNTDSALFYSDIEIKLLEQTHNHNLLANARHIKSALLYRLISPDAAEALLQKNLADKAVLADTMLAKSLILLAKVEIQKKMVTESFEHAMAASEIYSRLGDSLNTAACYTYIAGIHVFALGEPENSIPYFEKALTCLNPENELQITRLFVNYSSAYAGMGEFDKAIEKIRMAEMISLRSGQDRLIPDILVQYAKIYHHAEDNEKSLYYSLKADSAIKKSPYNDMRTQEKIYWYLASGYKAQKNYTKAIHYFKLMENSYLLDPWIPKMELIAIYKEMGMFEEAFTLQEKAIEAMDSTNTIERAEKLKEVTEKYENEKNEQEIATLSVEKELQKNQIKQQRFIFFGVSVFLVLVFGFAFYRYRTQLKLKETLQNLEKSELQQRFLRTQLNPHFFFHALTSIESYIYNNEKEEAATFLRDFSKLMRNTLEFSDVDFIPLQKDIEFIEKYIRLQQLSHDFKFNYRITTSDNLEAHKIAVPPMLIQPVVENAILHGALNTKNGMILIDYSLYTDYVEIKVNDNGKVKKKNPNASKKLNRSMSTSITRKRIENLKAVYGFEILYASSLSPEENETSSVSFKIPLNIDMNLLFNPLKRKKGNDN